MSTNLAPCIDWDIRFPSPGNTDEDPIEVSFLGISGTLGSPPIINWPSEISKSLSKIFLKKSLVVYCCVFQEYVFPPSIHKRFWTGPWNLARDHNRHSPRLRNWISSMVNYWTCIFLSRSLFSLKCVSWRNTISTWDRFRSWKSIRLFSGIFRLLVLRDII